MCCSLSLWGLSECSTNRFIFNTRLRNRVRDNTGPDIAATPKIHFNLPVFSVSAGDMKFVSRRAGIDWKIKTNVGSTMEGACLATMWLSYLQVWPNGDASLWEEVTIAFLEGEEEKNATPVVLKIAGTT